MEELSKIEKQIEEAKKKRKLLILKAMDGRTQAWLCEKTGISIPNMSRWINGVSDLSQGDLKKVSTALGVDFTK
ncbi:MAG TPA: helix-turn-helix transcriptional regulator [Hanamia sp.]|nr:helix-turn-helix transcriptional regulator [Hanamia sp.]